MKKTILLLLVLVLAGTALYANEAYVALNFAPVFSNVSATYNGTTTSGKATAILIEESNYYYWGHSGIVAKMRAGKTVSVDGSSVDSSVGFNFALGYSYITALASNLDFMADCLLQFAFGEEETGYVSGNRYSIWGYLGEIHIAAQLMYHISPITMLNAGIDVGRPVFYTLQGHGYYRGKAATLGVSGIRFSPFIGIGIKVGK